MAGVIQVWDMATSRERHRVELRGQPISHVAISPDGRWLAAGTFNEGKANLRVCEFPKIQERAVLDAHRSAVTSLAFTGDSRLLVSGGHNKTFRVWDVSRWSQTAAHKTDAEPCMIQVSPVRNCPLVAATSGQRGNEIVLWDYVKGQPIRKLVGHKEEVLRMSFSADGRLLASGTQGFSKIDPRAKSELKIWDVQRGAELASIPVDISGVTDLVFSPCGRLLACAEGNNAITLWKIASTAGNQASGPSKETPVGRK
jgi:WD40 repeat protein